MWDATRRDLDLVTPSVSKHSNSDQRLSRTWHTHVKCPLYMYMCFTVGGRLFKLGYIKSNVPRKEHWWNNDWCSSSLHFQCTCFNFWSSRKQHRLFVKCSINLISFGYKISIKYHQAKWYKIKLWLFNSFIFRMQSIKFAKNLVYKSSKDNL